MLLISVNHYSLSYAGPANGLGGSCMRVFRQAMERAKSVGAPVEPTFVTQKECGENATARGISMRVRWNEREERDQLRQP